MTKRLIDKKQLRTVKGIPYCDSQIYRLEKAGQFPRRVRLGCNRVAWLENEIDGWISEKAERRDGEPGTE